MTPVQKDRTDRTLLLPHILQRDMPTRMHAMSLKTKSASKLSIEDCNCCRVESWPWEEFGLIKQKPPAPKAKATRGSSKRKQPSTTTRGKQQAGRKKGRKAARAVGDNSAEESEEATEELKEADDDSSAEEAAPKRRRAAASRAAPLVKQQLKGQPDTKVCGRDS